MAVDGCLRLASTLCARPATRKIMMNAWSRGIEWSESDMNCPLCYLKLRAKLVDGVWKVFCKCGWHERP